VYLKRFVLLYADDTIIVSGDKISFQSTLNDFSNYCKECKIEINMSKSKIMFFGSNKPDYVPFPLDGKPLELVKEYKYLGVVFSSSGSFLSARKSLASQANKAMHLFIVEYSI
jgi:hypothetical protein